MLEVITPPEASDLTTLAAVKAEWPTEIAAPADAYLTRRIGEASALIAGELARVIGRQTVRQTWENGPWVSELVLLQTPVVEITTVEVDGVELEAGDWLLDRQRQTLRRRYSGYACPWGAVVTATYSGGWLLPGQDGRDLPMDIERAAIDYVLAGGFAMGRDPNVRSESAEGVGSASYLDPSAGGLPRRVAGMLDGYRRWN